MNENMRKMLEDHRDLLHGLSLKDLENLNKIVESSLKMIDKENAILIYLKCEYHLFRECLPENLIASFFLNEKINSKKCFSKILMYMNNINFKNSFERTQRMIAVANLGKYYENLDDDDFYSYLSIAICSKADHKSDYFIIDLFQNENMKMNPKKLELILSVVYNQDMSYNLLNGENATPYLLDILTNTKALLLDEMYYTKLIKLCFNNCFWYPFYIILKKHDLSVEQIRVVIDYYNTILFKYFQRYHVVTLKKLEENFRCDLFTVVFNSSFLTLNIEEYRSMLEHISTSPNPISYAKILNDKELDRKYIALPYLEQGEPSYKESSIVSQVDNKSYVARIAVSELARYLNDDEYDMLLSVVNSYINKDFVLEKTRNAGIEKSRIDYKKAQVICQIFEKGLFYKQNLPRLFYIVKLIMSSNDEYYISEITEIAINENTSFFTDEEFNLVLDTMSQMRDLYIQDKIKGEKYFCLKKYFTNSYIPFEQNIYGMITQVWKYDGEKLKELTEKYNNIVTEEKNIGMILNGYANNEKISKNIKRHVKK